MKEINYLEIIKNAFLMTWQNKKMWFFGLFIFLSSLSSTFNNSEITAEQKNQLYSRFQGFFQTYPLASASVAFIIILVLIALFLLKLASVAALIKISNNISVYRQAGIKNILSECKPYIWRLLVMNILVLISVFAIITLVLLPIVYLFSLGSVSLASVFLIFGVIIIALLLILAYYLLRYGQIYLVLGDMDLKSSLESAYELLENHLKSSLAFGLISIALNLIFLITLMLIIVIVGFVFTLLGFFVYQFFSQTGTAFFIILGAILLLIAIAALFSWFNAFIQSAWVLFFQQISLEKKQAKKEKETKLETDAIVPDPEAV